MHTMKAPKKKATKRSGLTLVRALLEKLIQRLDFKDDREDKNVVINYEGTEDATKHRKRWYHL